MATLKKIIFVFIKFVYYSCVEVSELTHEIKIWLIIHRLNMNFLRRNSVSFWFNDSLTKSSRTKQKLNERSNITGESKKLWKNNELEVSIWWSKTLNMWPNHVDRWEVSCKSIWNFFTHLTVNFFRSSWPSEIRFQSLLESRWLKVSQRLGLKNRLDFFTKRKVALSV